MSPIVEWILTPKGRALVTLAVFGLVTALKHVAWVKKYVLKHAVAKQAAALVLGSPVVVGAWLDGAPLEEVGGLAFHVLIGSMGVHDMLGGWVRQFPALAGPLARLLGGSRQPTPPPRSEIETEPTIEKEKGDAGTG